MVQPAPADPAAGTRTPGKLPQPKAASGKMPTRSRELNPPKKGRLAPESRGNTGRVHEQASDRSLRLPRRNPARDSTRRSGEKPDKRLSAPE